VTRLDAVLSKARMVAARLSAKGEVDDGTLAEVEQLIASAVVVRMSLLRHLHGTARAGDTPPTTELGRRVAGFEEQLLSIPERRQRAARAAERGWPRLVTAGGRPAEATAPPVASPVHDTEEATEDGAIDQVDSGRSLNPMVFELWEIVGRGRVFSRLHAHVNDAAAYGVLWAARSLPVHGSDAMAQIGSFFDDGDAWRVVEQDEEGYPARVVSADGDLSVLWELETDVKGRRCVQAQFDGPWAWVDVWTVADSPRGGCVIRCERYTAADRATCAAVADEGWSPDDSEELESIVWTIEQVAANCTAGGHATPQAS
jgi:hypothetical protein